MAASTSARDFVVGAVVGAAVGAAVGVGRTCRAGRSVCSVRRERRERSAWGECRASCWERRVRVKRPASASTESTRSVSSSPGFRWEVTSLTYRPSASTSHACSSPSFETPQLTKAPHECTPITTPVTLAPTFSVEMGGRRSARRFDGGPWRAVEVPWRAVEAREVAVAVDTTLLLARLDLLLLLRTLAAVLAAVLPLARLLVSERAGEGARRLPL